MAKNLGMKDIYKGRYETTGKPSGPMVAETEGESAVKCPACGASLGLSMAEAPEMEAGEEIEEA